MKEIYNTKDSHKWRFLPSYESLLLNHILYPERDTAYSSLPKAAASAAAIISSLDNSLG